MSRALIVAGLLAAGCATPRAYSVLFMPSPAEVRVTAPAVEDSQVRALASILAVVRPDATTGRGVEVEARLRLENLGRVPAALALESLQLLSSNLVPFGPARVSAASGEPIAPGAAASVDVVFPVDPQRPAEEIDWKGLSLRFTLRFADHESTASMSFTSAVPDYYYNYYYGGYHSGMWVGYGPWCW